MPRVTCLDSQTIKDRQVYALIEQHLILLDKSDADIAAYLGIHVSTFRRKKHHPSQFTLLEIQRVAKYLNFDKDEKASCL